ncbi:MAG: alpha/beta fold hydrolase [Aeromicrobium sp.]
MHTHELTRPDDMTIAFHEWNSEAPGTPVVLQHGYVANTDINWVATGVVDALTAAGRRVIGVDARGHGRSGTSPDSALYGERTMAADVSAVADTLGLDEYHLVGYSMGAVIALLTAGRDGRVSRLAIGGVGAGVVEVGGVDTRALDRDVLAEALLDDGDLSGYPPEVLAFRQFADHLGSDKPSLAAQARVVHSGSVELERVTVPTLLLAGRDDPLAVRPEVLADALPDGTLRVVAGDHLGAVVAPDFAPSIVEFLG